MLTRVPLIVLLVVQVLGGGAVTLAHARDVVAAPPGVEASHDERCAILHDEMRCALCHYASARVVTHQLFTLATPGKTTRLAPLEPIVSVASVGTLTSAARAPPTDLS